MAESNGIAGVHPVKAAWKEMWVIQGEAFSLCELYSMSDVPEVAWSCLAHGVLQRLTDVVDRLEAAYRDDGLSPLTFYEHADDLAGDPDEVETGTISQAGAGAVNGGMGAVAPMGTEVVDGELTSSRK